MRRRIRLASLASVLVLLGWGLTGTLCAQQGMNVGGMTMPPSMGPLASPQGQMAGASKPGSQATDPGLNITDSYVSFIDGAAPRNVVGLRFEGMYGNQQPMRSEYLFAKGGLPNSAGFSLPETRVNTLELTSYAEYAIMPWFSMFIEAPYRWVSPSVNNYQYGAGDMRYGLKLCTWSSDSIVATVLLRIYQPTASHETLGTGHWSLEPGLLAAYRVNPNILIEGEIRYWTALGGSDFAGDLVRYGVGVSYGQRTAGVWYMPVLEGVGWTVLSGKTMIASSPDNFAVQDAHGQTIVNAYLGLRVGYGKSLDFYLGYGHSLTGLAWARETYRFEMRFSY
jgi:hypothetical protein